MSVWVRLPSYKFRIRRCSEISAPNAFNNALGKGRTSRKNCTYFYPSAPQRTQHHPRRFSNHPKAMASDPSNATVTCPRDGSRWYACDSGSRFVGCCKLDPCKHGCDKNYIGAASFSASSFEQIPEAGCPVAASFYMCSKLSASISSYWGCCKSMACGGFGCPVGDVSPAYVDRPEQFKFYSSMHEQLPVRNTSDTWVDTPLSAPARRTGTLSGPNKDLILTGLSAALFVIIPIAIAVWITSRQVKTRFGKTRRQDETYVLRKLFSSHG
jgi:hypothetical protein